MLSNRPASIGRRWVHGKNEKWLRNTCFKTEKARSLFASHLPVTLNRMTTTSSLLSWNIAKETKPFGMFLASNVA